MTEPILHAIGFDDGDVLVAKAGLSSRHDARCSAVRPEPCTIQNSVASLRPIRSYNVRLIRSMFSALAIRRGYSCRIVTGKRRCRASSRSQISSSVRIAVPPTQAEQEAIAEALSDADALIESLEQLLAKKRQLKQGAMQELLTGKKRLPGFSGEWEVKRIGELGSRCARRHRISKSSTTRSSTASMTGIDTSRTADLRSGHVTHIDEVATTSDLNIHLQRTTSCNAKSAHRQGRLVDEICHGRR